MSRPSQRLIVLVVSSLCSLALAGWILPRVTRPAPTRDSREPAAGVFHIYMLGGSTAEGGVYAPRCDVAELVSYLFKGELAGRRIEVSNLAGSGEDTARALKHAREIRPIVDGRDAAVALLYSGDNEFLKFVDPRQSSRGERRLFDTPLVPAGQRAQVLRDYMALVEEIACTCDRANVPLVVCTGTMNIADREPNRSVLDDARNEPAVRKRLDRADVAFAKNDLPAALAELDRALEIEPHFAWTHKRRGDVLRRMGRVEEAHAALQAAVDFDQAPMSFTSMQNDALRAFAKQRGLALVDAEALVRAASEDGLPGYDVFWDNCHPRMEGYLCMASGIADVLEERHHVQRKRASPSAIEVESAYHIDGEFMTELLMNRGRYMYGLALLTWNPSARLAQARAYLDEAARRVPDSAALACSRAVLSLIEGDLEKSCVQWRKALALDAAMARERVRHPSVVWLLHAKGVEDPLAVFGP